MGNNPSSNILANLPSAFAAACRVSRSEGELFERCRDVLIRRVGDDRIWLTIKSSAGNLSQAGPAAADNAVKVANLGSGSTEVTITADPAIAEQLRGSALPLALGLSVVLELRSVLLERQAQLTDAVFQLRALRQAARLLSSVHSAAETEQLVLDFMAEVFFSWWACLFRPAGKSFEPAAFRSRDETPPPQPIAVKALEEGLPPGSMVTTGEEVALASLLPKGTQLVVPLDAGADRLALMVLGPRINKRPYGRPEHELAATLSFAAAIALKNAELVERLHSAATTDELTGLYNRRALEERLDAELSRGTRHQLRTSVVLLDIDRFKPINDTLGHAAGDRLLTMLGEILRQECRTLDVVGRLGGDEFLVVLPMTSAREAMVFVERVQRRIADINKLAPEFGPQSVSIGVAQAPDQGSNVNAILAAADEAMYQAKRSGRDNAVVAGE